MDGYNRGCHSKYRLKSIFKIMNSGNGRRASTYINGCGFTVDNL